MRFVRFLELGHVAAVGDHGDPGAWERLTHVAREACGDQRILFPEDEVRRHVDGTHPLPEALLAVRLDPWLRERAGMVAPILRHAWALVAVGLVLRFITAEVGDVLLPLWVLLAIAGTAYGNLLRRHARGDHRPARLAYVSLVVAMLTLAMFWQTERLARLTGEELARDLKENLADRQPAVTLFSTGALQLDTGGVVESELTGTDNDYRYRYDGLYFLQRSGGKYFLLTEGWTDDEGRLIVLVDTEDIRLEFGGATARRVTSSRAGP
jgi:hypothetical protein